MTDNRQRIAVSGASGLIGSALCRSLEADGHRPLPMVRRDSSKDDEIPWDPSNASLDPGRLAAVDAVVHLAGENIAGGRWTRAKKARILNSRVDGTALVAGALRAHATAGGEVPSVLVCASAIGFYGDRGDEELDESSAVGDGFLADVCRRWEEAAEPARRAGVRVVHLRFGIVLSQDGGALAEMATPFRLGVGGPVGGGRQWQSWIHLDDAVAAIRHALAHPDLAGPVNAVAPSPVRQRTFAESLGRVLGRPAVVPLPAFAVRLLFGEMGEELLLASTRVEPKALVDSGFAFEHADLESALRQEMG